MRLAAAGVVAGPPRLVVLGGGERRLGVLATASRLCRGGGKSSLPSRRDQTAG